MTVNPTSRLLSDISQFEVDFVIPRVGVDIPLGIDPFLLFKSRDPDLSNLHVEIVTAFNQGIGYVREGRLDAARSLLDFPEPPEIGFGYTAQGRRGSGVGPITSEVIIETLRSSEALCSRGVRHPEEMQLFAVGVGPDRVSDIAANLMKHFLISYTQRQAELWGIPIRSAVPVKHVLDYASLEWIDGHFDLPVSPVDGRAMLLVPRRIVRALPWINYGDFLRSEFAAFHRAKRARKRVTRPAGSSSTASKHEVAEVNRREVDRVDQYVRRKEDQAADAQPSLEYLDSSKSCPEADRLKAAMEAVPAGKTAANDYQRLTLEMLNYLFNPELIDGQMEVRTIDGTERRDIIFTNDSDHSFWTYLRTEHSSIFIMFEVKNKEALEQADVNQTATYIGDRLGRIGFICTRSSATRPILRKMFAIYNDSSPRKVVIAVSDSDFATMLDMKCLGRNPVLHLRKLYRDFRTSVQ